MMGCEVDLFLASPKVKVGIKAISYHIMSCHSHDHISSRDLSAHPLPLHQNISFFYDHVTGLTYLHRPVTDPHLKLMD